MHKAGEQVHYTFPFIFYQNLGSCNPYAVFFIHHTFPLSSIRIYVPVTHKQFFSWICSYCLPFFFLNDRIVYCILFDYFCQQTLVRVAVWCIGEYGEMLVNNFGRLDIEEPTTVSSCFWTVVSKYDLWIFFFKSVLLHILGQLVFYLWSNIFWMKFLIHYCYVYHDWCVYNCWISP